MKIPFLKKNIPLLRPLEGYDRWAKTYSTESNPVKDASNESIKKLLPPLKGLDILDAGCGAGYFCSIAEKSDAREITGLDFSAPMIEVAKKNCVRTKFILGDITSIEFPSQSFDLVICALVVGHIEDLNLALSHLTKPLKTDGLLVLSDFHPFLTITKKKRTFRDVSGSVFEISHHLHMFQDYVHELTNLGLVIEELTETVWNDMPVVFTLKARKKVS